MLKIQEGFILTATVIFFLANAEEFEYYSDVDEVYYDDAEVMELCKDIPPEHYIPSPRGDHYYIYCGKDTEDRFEGKCPVETPIFRDGVCDIPLNTSSTKKTTKTTATKPTTKSTKTTKTTSTKKSTSKTTTSTKSTTKTTTKSTTLKPTTTKRPSDPKSCPSEDTSDYVIFLSSNNSCAEYFICYHGYPFPMYCSNKLHFNSAISKCDFPVKANCKISEPNRPFPKCKTLNQIEYYQHPDHCNYFLCCIYGQMSVQQCPYFHNWDVKSQSCIPKYLSTCQD